MSQGFAIHTETSGIQRVSNTELLECLEKVMVIMKDRFGEIHVIEICQVIKGDK